MHGSAGKVGCSKDTGGNAGSSGTTSRVTQARQATVKNPVEAFP